MKMWIKKSFVLSVFVVGLFSLLVGQLPAQTFKTLHNFGGSSAPASGLILSSNTLYGTTSTTVFALNNDGTGFRTLHSLNGGTDGGAVFAGLVLSGNTLYGTASDAGSGSGAGTVFAVNTDGTGFTTLDSFSGWDGSLPSSELVLSGSTLYGVTSNGGDLGTGGGYGCGTVFAINTDGSAFTSLYNFLGANDGRLPRGLVLSNNTLFGTTETGGTFGSAGAPVGSGTVFAINTDGSGFVNLYSFTAPSTNSYGVYTNSDGFRPRVGLLLSGGSFYGATTSGGKFGSGTIFRLQADGSGFTNLYNFSELPSSGPSTNSSGAQPLAVLSIFGQTLYGMTYIGGDFGNGSIFAINTDGTGFTTLYSFKGAVGPTRRSGLVLSGNTLYGAAGDMVFSISFEPRLSIVPSGPNVILTWPTSYAGFDYTGYTLQSTTNFNSPVWTTNLPAPVVVNGQNTVANPITGSQQFFRLSQ
jgi:uncharacterized repeat protein (TIGR03803 family)